MILICCEEVLRLGWKTLYRWSKECRFLHKHGDGVFLWFLQLLLERFQAPLLRRYYEYRQKCLVFVDGLKLFTMSLNI